MSGQGEAEPRGARRLLIDLTPLRRSRDFRHLVWGELVSVLGNQLTTVAVPYQVYQLTHSSLDVGLVSVTQLFPLIAGSLLGGSVVDAMDRRRLLMIAQVLMAACSAGLAVNADLGTRAVAAVRAARAVGRVQRPGQRRTQRHRAEPGPPVRGVHGERHLPGAVPVRPGGGAGAGRAAAGRGGRPLRVLAGRGRLRGGAVRRVPDLAAAGPRARPPAGSALGHGGPALRARQAGHRGRVPDRHQRHGVRHAAGAVPGAGGDAVRRGRGHARVPVRRARRGRPGSARSPPAGCRGSSGRAWRSSWR